MVAKFYKDSKQLIIAATYKSDFSEIVKVETEKEAKQICKERKIKLLK